MNRKQLIRHWQREGWEDGCAYVSLNDKHLGYCSREGFSTIARKRKISREMLCQYINGGTIVTAQSIAQIREWRLNGD